MEYIHRHNQKGETGVFMHLRKADEKESIQVHRARKNTNQ